MRTKEMIQKLTRQCQNRTLNKWALDNLTTHICALTLLIDNYEVDMYDIREDLKLENKQ